MTSNVTLSDNPSSWDILKDLWKGFYQESAKKVSSNKTTLEKTRGVCEIVLSIPPMVVLSGCAGIAAVFDLVTPLKIDNRVIPNPKPNQSGMPSIEAMLNAKNAGLPQSAPPSPNRLEMPTTLQMLENRQKK